MKHIWTWMVFSMCLYGIFAVSTLFIDDFFWITVWANSVTLIAFFGIAIIPTYWVLNKVGLNHKDIKNMNKQRQMEILRALKNSHQLSHYPSQDKNIIKPKLRNNGAADSVSKDFDLQILKLQKSDSFNDDLTFLRDILSDYHGYCAFMAHLGKEFATECLLSFTEFIQFKHYLLKTFPFLANKIVSKININREDSNTIDIASQIPVWLCLYRFVFFHNFLACFFFFRFSSLCCGV